MLKTTPLWTEDAALQPGMTADELPAQVDVAVIGSGYTGLTAALALASSGAAVAVLEQETIGWGASSRNGGMMTTGLKESMPVLFKRHGRELGCELWHWALASIDHVETTVAEEGIDCAFERSGHATLAFKPSHARMLEEEAGWFARELTYGAAHFVPRDGLAAEIGSRSYYGALVDTNSAAVQPAAYVFGLAQAAARRGARLFERAGVKRVEAKGERYLLHSALGPLEASAVLVATNGYTTGVVPHLRRGVFPVGSYVIATAPLSAALQAELSPRRRMFFDSKHFLNYFRLTPDGRMLFGGRHDLSTALALTESARLLRQRMVEVFPQIAETPITHSWTGHLGLTFDLMPHAGRIESGDHRGLYYAYGYAGHGVSVASLLGSEMGEWIAGRRGPPILAGLRQQRYPFTRYNRFYLPLVSSWFRWLDRIS